MKKHTARRSFVMSLLALLMCVAMLITTTFAWFTDSVTSGRNKIVAGNLDVELYHSAAATLPTGASSEKVGLDTKLFEGVTLWEPGAVCYENLMVKNEGNLALKYKLDLNVYDKNSYDGHDLTEVIKVAVVEGGFTGDRTAAQAITSYTTLADFQKTGELLTNGASETYGVVLYWEPTDHDNDYNMNNGRTASDGYTHTDSEPALFVEFGINLVATQKDYEDDSFDNTYDQLAEFPVAAIAKVEAGKATTLNAYDANNTLAAKAVIPADAVSGADSIEMTVDEVDKPATLTLTAEQKAINLDVKFFSVASDGAKTQITDFGTTVVNVDLSAQIPDAYALDAVYHTHGGVTNAMTKAESAAAVTVGQFFFNPATKLLTIGSSTFSPFSFVVSPYEIMVTGGEETEYMSLADFRNSVNSGTSYAGKTAKLLKDVTLSGEWAPIGTATYPYDGSFDGNSKTITGLTITAANSEGTGFFGYVNNANNAVIFKNLTLKDANVNLGASAGKNVGIFMGYVLKANKDITVDNVDVTGSSAVYAKSHVGGIIGKIYGENVTLKNCDSNAAVTCASLYAGGIIAIASDSAQTIVFNNCNNTGAVSGSNSGGIVGRTGSKDVSFTACTNSGNVTGTAVAGGVVGTAEGTLSLTIDAATNCTGTVTGETKGLLIGYTYVYSSASNKVTITRSGNTEYADTADLGLIGSFGVSEITVINAKLHRMDFSTSWKNVVKVNLVNSVVDDINWTTSSGEHGTGTEAHANDGEYFYLNGNNNSTVTNLNYTQTYTFYKNYYSFKDISGIEVKTNDDAPLVSVAWYE